MLANLKSLFSTSEVEHGPVLSQYQAIQDHDQEDDMEPRLKARRDDWGVYLSFWGLGAGILLSWNVLICTLPLLSSFFPVESPIRSHLASYLATIFCFGNLFVLGAIQRKVNHTSPSARLHWSLLLLIFTSLIITFPCLPLLTASSTASSLLLIPIFALTLLLSVATSYLQAAVFALAAMWGSSQMLAVMSGQGGIAVLISSIQVVLAIIASGKTEQQSVVAGVGLWAAATLGAFACLIAHRYLMTHPDYRIVLAPLEARENGVGDDGTADNVARKVFWANIEVEAAVAWVFIVTLVGLYVQTTTDPSVSFSLDHHLHRVRLPVSSAPSPTRHLHSHSFLAPEQ
ncbi:hypothetical protein P7C73_g2984, partial [Tremellales sp. Uapishka_1]